MSSPAQFREPARPEVANEVKALATRPPSGRTSMILFVVAVGLMALVRLCFFPDRFITLSYGLPLLICLWHMDRRLLWAMVAAFLTLSVVKTFVLLAGAVADDPFQILLWLMQVINIVVMAGFIDAVIRLARRLRAHNAQLQAANTELAAQKEQISQQNTEIQAQSEELAQQNEELTQQSEELSRQNEELQQQAEELEQQTEEVQAQAEELRFSNHELSRREAMVEAFLTSLRDTGDEQQLLTRIAHAALELVGGSALAAALVERVGDELVVRAPAGLDLGQDRWPFGRSFAALVINQNQTGFVEDLDQRPDLIVPRPGTGQFRSILATPLRVRGQPMGAVEIYSAEPHLWTRDDFRIIEWVAAEASLVLDLLRLQNELRQSRDQLAWVLKKTGIGMWLNELPLNRLNWDEQTRQLFFLPPTGEITIDLFWSRVHPDDREPTRIAVEAALQQHTLYEIDHRAVHPETGEVRWIRSAGQATYAEDGRPTRFDGINYDITPRKQAEAELREARDQLEQRVVDRTRELADTVAQLQAEILKRKEASRGLERAHAQLQDRSEQLRALVLELTQAEERERRRVAQVLHDHVQQLLASMRFQTEFIAAEAEAPAIREAAATATGILQEALAATRTLTGELSPAVLQTANLAEPLRWLARWMQERHQLNVTVRSDSVDTDQRELRELIFRCVRELLFNIVKHAGVRSADVELTRTEDKVRIRVSDRGHGFDPQHLSEPRTDGGFGLLSVRERLEHCGGEFHLLSAPGQGTQVTLLIPVMARSADAERPPRPAPASPAPPIPQPPRAPIGPAARRIRTVVVDDHHVARAGLRGALERHADFEVVGEAATAADALAEIRRLLPDVVIMDVNLPDRSGIEITQQLVGEFPKLRVIGFSMHEEGPPAEAMRAAGACGFVSKGAPVAELIAALRHYCHPSVRS